jgi:TonB-dependent SusC/RagA subfamily outer membrane receptor
MAIVMVHSGCARGPSSGTAAAPPQSSAVAPRQDPTGKTLAELFQGKFAGVEAFSVNGGVRIRIRNSANLDGSGGDPLFVIDDLPVSPPDGVLRMNPNDIVKIEVLKDDASTMIYGIKAANGVVKITTKRK